MDSTLVAVDLAKSVFEVAVSPSPGRVSRRHRFSRAQFEAWIAQTERAVFLLEACGSAHFWGRTLRGHGHSVVLIPPHVVRRYVAGNKTDRSDTKALLEAWRNEDIRPVPVKDVSHQALAALHRVRSSWMTTRTARINEIRGVLRELGFTIPVGADRFLLRAAAVIGDRDNILPNHLREVLDLLVQEIAGLDGRIAGIEKTIDRLGKEITIVPVLRSIPGVGLLSSTAAYTNIVDISRFRSGRAVANSLGLTPREHSSGNRRWLGAITKRGDRYLRMLLIHGARSVLLAAKKKTVPSKLEAWALGREQALGHNRAAVALANKLARLIWAVWTHGTPYVPQVA
jgi:transposase